MIKALSIIHGTRRLTKPMGSAPPWPDKLKIFMEEMGFSKVVPYYWSGSLLEPFTQKGTDLYAKHLHDYFFRENPNDKIELYIITKSMGSLIAEGGLAAYYRITGESIFVQTLLRLGAPGNRSAFQAPNIMRVVDVRSSNDKLCAIASPVVYLITRILCYKKRNYNIIPEIIDLKILNHSDFNYNKDYDMRPNFSGGLFYWYYKILVNSF